MKLLSYLLTVLIAIPLVGIAKADENLPLGSYARLAAQMELDAGALDSALDEGADTAMIGSIDVLEYDLGRSLTADEKKKVTLIFREALSGILTPEIWVESTAKVYAQHLDPEDLKNLTDFYRTESGAKILAAQTPLSRDLGDAADKLLDAGQERFAGQVDAALEELFPEYGLVEFE